MSDKTHLIDPTTSVSIDYGDHREEVSSWVGLGNCEDCDNELVPVRRFELPNVAPEPYFRTLCRECFADDPDIELVSR